MEGAWPGTVESDGRCRAERELNTKRSAETYLRLLAEAELRRAQVEATSGAGPGQRRGSQRLQAVASVLATVGALPVSVAESVINDHSVALAARSFLPAPMLLPAQPGSLGPMSVGGTVSPGQSPGPAGSPVSRGPAPVGVTARLVGVMLALDDGSASGELHLLAMVSSPGQVVLTMVAYGAPVAGTTRHLPMARLPFQALSAVDDHGATHGLGANGEAHQDCWEGKLVLDSGSASLPRWLDIFSQTGGRAVRADLTAPSTVCMVAVEGAPAATTGERLLEAAGEVMLGQSGMMARVQGAVMLGDLDVVREALEIAGELPEASGAIGHLASLARTLGIEVPKLAGGISQGKAGLPERWASVLVDRGRKAPRRGPEGLLPVAVVLPELEGATFALAGLRSTEDHFSLHVCCFGWQPAQTGFRRGWGGDLSFSWWAQDSNGQWHVGAPAGWGSAGSMADMRLHFVPPLDASAKWLELVVTGRESLVKARFALEWGPAS